jgi:hypothetical protein
MNFSLLRENWYPVDTGSGSFSDMSSNVREIGANFWNIRSSFRLFAGLVNVGDHMSLIRLSTGRFLVLDACRLKQAEWNWIDHMTDGGSLIDAVIATHPFHTCFFEPFNKKYPNAKYYGTPRHLKQMQSIPWICSVTEVGIQEAWESEGIFMRIPAGADFDPADSTNHFCGMFVYHQPSRTLFNDDTLSVYERPGIMGQCMLALMRKKPEEVIFWPGGFKKGLKHTRDAPLQFLAFMEKVLEDWDIDNICTAHNGVKRGDAKQSLRHAIDKARPTLQHLADKWATKHVHQI